MIRTRRVYTPPTSEDGRRFLVDRLWPRGVRKDALAIDAWLRDVAPSNLLRKTFHHDPARWDEFKQAYFTELDANPDAWQPILAAAAEGNVTLLYAARDEQYNNAEALKEYLASR